MLIEFWNFLKVRKKFWLLPMLLVLGLLALLVFFSQTTAAPFVYTLF